ncbi:MAG: NAD(+)/NADH kinase [Caldilineales bacterium]|nr:NAD(+)/NADH kinase [Caldilineales bacterium]
MAKEISRWVDDRGHTSWVGSGWNVAAVDAILQGVDLVIALGGDGTLLRTGRVTARHQVPILGIHMGRLGFLTEILPEEWRDSLSRILDGDYWLEQRFMLQAEVWRDGALLDGALQALNEVVVSRGSLARVVRIAAEIDDSLLTTYVADGVIVATPTGSTAYALAAGGPILPPDMNASLLLPIAPHLSLARPLVLDHDAEVILTVRTDHAAILTVDGQFLIDLQDGDKVVVAPSPYEASFVRLRPRNYYYSTLVERLRLTV